MKTVVFLTLFLFSGISLVRALNNSLSLQVLFSGAATNRVWFSPNYDGAQDTVSFSLSIRDDSRIEGWIAAVYDSSGHEVWHRSGERNRDVPIDPGLFISKLISKKDSVPIPQVLTWDGTSDSGSVLPEGKYFLIAAVRDEMGNNLVSDTNEIILDITPPAGSLSLEDNIFYPDSPGKKGLIFISQDLSTNAFWKAEIRGREGNVEKTWDWGQDPPMHLEWDGKNEKGDILPEGSYDYIAFGWDRAGNKAMLPLAGINLSRKTYSVFLNPEREGFSPAASYPSNIIKFFPAVSVKNGFVAWVLKISDFSYKTVREIKGKALPPYLSWDGRDNGGNLVKDGIFHCSLGCEYNDGEKIYSPENTVTVGTRQPVVELYYEPDVFSPDGDGENDTLFIHLKVKIEGALKKWKISIYDPDDKPFKTFEGYRDPPAVIPWDGRSDNGELVESAEDYKIKAAAIDAYGNLTEKEIDKRIKVDVLAEKTARGLLIRINSIEFEFAGSKLAPKRSFILDRVAQILQKYPLYRVEVDGHTDNIGSMKKNRELSEARARTVYNYLLGKGIIKTRMSVMGFAYRYPVADNRTSEGRRKNRRVEFILKKD